MPYTNVIRAGEDTVTTTITAPATAAANCKLYLSTDSTTSNALTNGSNTIPATTGTILEPVALTGNSWGFALNNTTPGIAENGFGNSYDAQLPVVDKDSKWAGVPTKGNEVMFQSIPMNQTTTNTNIYYAVSAKDDLAEGTYTGSIVYTAIYEATDIPTGELTLTPTEGTAGDEITLTSSVVPTMADIGAFDIKLVDPDTSTEYTCENTVTSKTNQGNLQAKCNVPELPEAKAYDVTATYNKTGITYTATEQFNYLTPIPPACDTLIPDGPTYMQDFNPSTDKTKMTKEAQYKLIDKRDNKPYCVSLLKDEKVWMTQNLDFDITGEKLTSADTNLVDTTEWTPDHTTIPKDQISTWDDTYTSPRSYDPGGEAGEYIFTSNTTSDDTVYTSLEACIQDSHTASECAHYSSGNYYNWTAAKATNDSSGQASESTSSNDSICPKGWTLPSAQSSASDFGIMLNAQGIISSATSVSYATDGFNNIRIAPLYWVRAGEVSGGVSSRRYKAGNTGHYWSSTTLFLTISGARYAYNAYFDSSYITPRSGGYIRSSGESVRCIAL